MVLWVQSCVFHCRILPIFTPSPICPLLKGAQRFFIYMQIWRHYDTWTIWVKQESIPMMVDGHRGMTCRKKGLQHERVDQILTPSLMRIYPSPPSLLDNPSRKAVLPPTPWSHVKVISILDVMTPLHFRAGGLVGQNVMKQLTHFSKILHKIMKHILFCICLYSWLGS